MGIPNRLQIDVGASPHLFMDDWNLPAQVQRRLSRTQAGLNRSGLVWQ